MILPNDNIDIIDVRNVTGYPSIDLGTLCSCGEPYINKWSKCKPVIHNCFGSGAEYYPSDWYKGTAKNCGIIIKEHQYLTDLISSVQQSNWESVNYKYQPPTGGASSPYRLGDFKKYSTDAIPPLTGSDNDQLEFSKEKGNIPIQCEVNTDLTGNSLTVLDIYKGYFTNIYYGVALVSTVDSSRLFWKTSDNEFSSNIPMEVSFPVDVLCGFPGTRWSYKVYQFLTDRNYGWQTGNQRGRFLALPDTNYNQTITIASDVVNIDATLTIESYDPAGRIRFRVNVFNKSKSAFNIDSCLIEFKYTNGYPDGVRPGAETQLSINDLPQIKAGEEFVSKIYNSNSYTLPKLDAEHSGEAILYLNGKIYDYCPIDVDEGGSLMNLNSI